MNRSAKDVAQELDINYTISAGNPFYVGFSRGIHVRNAMPVKERPLILGFDYGFTHPDCVICQQTIEGRFIVVDNLFGYNETIDEFGERVQTYIATEYPNFVIGQCFGDPAGKQMSDKSRLSSEHILWRMGFRISSIPSNSAFSNYNARKNIIEKKLKTLIGGIPSLIINNVPNNQILIEGFEGGYRYPDANKYGAVTESPAPDDYFEHPFNALEYVIINLYRKPEFQRQPSPAVVAYRQQQRTEKFLQHSGKKKDNYAAGFGY